MNDKIITSAVIPFEDEVEGGFLTIEIDPDRNEGRYSFSPGDTVNLDVITSASIVLRFASQGTLQTDGSGVREIEEYIPVFQEGEARLRYPPQNFSYQWLGPDRGGVVIDGTTLRFESDETIGLLKVNYEINVLYYQLVGVFVIEQIMVAMLNADNQHDVILISFLEEEEEENDVTIIVRDYSTGAAVPGVEVYVDEGFKGLTDAEGKVYIGKQAQGTYALRLVGPSPYLASEDDGLANDEYTLE
jgi:hypothetical protein